MAVLEDSGEKPVKEVKQKRLGGPLEDSGEKQVKTQSSKDSGVKVKQNTNEAPVGAGSVELGPKKESIGSLPKNLEQNYSPTKDETKTNTAKDERNILQRGADALGASDIGQFIAKSPGGRLVSAIGKGLSGKSEGEQYPDSRVGGQGRASTSNKTNTPEDRERDFEPRGSSSVNPAIAGAAGALGALGVPGVPGAPVTGPSIPATGTIDPITGVDTRFPHSGRYSPDGADVSGGVTSSMGEDATDMLNRGYNASEGIAAKAANNASVQAARNALKSAKTAGLNAGQSALVSGQVAADTYGNSLQQQLESGQNRYQQGTSQFLTREQQLFQAKAEADRLELEAKRLEQEGNIAAAAAAREKKHSILNAIGSGIGAVASFFGSDENFKDNIKKDSSLDGIMRKLKPVSLDSILGKIKPVNYNYKGEDQKQVGITAQDLEKTPLAGAVMNTDMGKFVDGAQLEGSNLALIIELASMVKDLQKKVGK